MSQSTLCIFRYFAAASFLISASCATVIAEELRWHFQTSENTAQAFLSDCTNCDGAMFSAICTKGESVTLIPQMNVKGGKAGETRNVTFQFGDGAVDVAGTLVANEMEGSIEPEITVRTDHEILRFMQEFDSVELMVHLGPSLMVPLKGARNVLAKLQSFCRS